METKLQSKLNATTGGLSYSALIVCFLLFTFAQLIAQACGLQPQTEGYVYLSYLISPVAILACLFAVLPLRKVSIAQAFPVKCHIKYYGIALLLAFGLMFSFGWVNQLTVSFFELFGYTPKPAESYLPNTQGWLILPVLLVVAVLPALCEEVLFRGLLLNTTNQTAGDIAAILLSSLCFTLYHGSPEQTVYQFICGCAYAFLAIRARSVGPTALMHFLNNALVILFTTFGVSDVNGNFNIEPWGNVLLIVCGALCFGGAVVLLIFDKKPLIKAQKGEVVKFFIFASVGIVVMSVVWLMSLLGGFA